MSLEFDGKASHKRLGQDHLPLLHLPCPHLHALHVIVSKWNDKIMENDGNYDSNMII